MKHEDVQETPLRALAHRLLDPGRARVAVEPMRSGAGHWFGGGNVVEADDGTLYLCGRYRNAGDARSGLGAGERGLELALWRSDDRGARWEKLVALDKAALAPPGREVVSIEGSTLAWTDSGVELFVSTEKTGVRYGHGLDAYLKPGAGVWSIERLAAPSVEALVDAQPVPLIACEDPCHVHVKDPHAYRMRDGSLALVLCTHPFTWSSTNSAYALRRAGEDRFAAPIHDFFPRGTTWDVAIARVTCLLDVPRVGAFTDVDATLVFYDGGESLRDLEPHAEAVARPRGYSCEELGGLAYLLDAGADGRLRTPERISRYLPEFASAEGTGCHRYVDVARITGGYLATWQRSSADRAQPLMSCFVGDDEVAALLR